MKKQFEALNGLRGVAAIVVLLHHVGAVTGHENLSPFGYLGVDLFFVISGFVIGSAYEGRLAAGLGFARYIFDIRVIRMYPMILLGAVFGLASALTGAVYVPNPATAVAKEIFLVPTLLPLTLFPLNIVMWSLMLELLANAIHAALFRYLTLPVLKAVVVISGFTLLASQIHYHILDVGWRGPNIAGGIPRVAFSFFLGLLIFRLHAAGRLPQVRAPFSILAAALAAAMLIPLPAGIRHIQTIHDFFAVFLVFPLVIVAAAQIDMDGIEKRASDFLGGLSYPLYAIHFPILKMLVFFAAASAYLNKSPLVFWAISCIAILALSSLIDRWIEKPFQDWWRKRRAKFIRPGA